jgi:hypothetical protein
MWYGCSNCRFERHHYATIAALLVCLCSVVGCDDADGLHAHLHEHAVLVALEKAAVRALFASSIRSVTAIAHSAATN